MARKLILIPLEPIKERYTEQWYRRFPKHFNETFDVTIIDGMPLLDGEIKVGSFLDMNSTVHYKMTQLAVLAFMFNAGTIEPDTIIFFYDIEFWGLESVRLMSQLNNVPVKIAGFLHAASFTRGDAFEVAAPYQQFTEVGWAAALDMIFVGSSYAKESFVTRRLAPAGAENLASRIQVTANPMFPSEYPDFALPKENLVVLTNRFDSEKGVGETLRLFELAKQEHPDWEFRICTGRPTLRGNDEKLIAYARHLEEKGVLTIHAGLTKDEYHRTLARARVMVTHSREENYGYCIAEALTYRCLPLMTPVGSHHEWAIHPRQILNCSWESQLESLEWAMANQESMRQAMASAPLLLMSAHAMATMTSLLESL